MQRLLLYILFIFLLSGAKAQDTKVVEDLQWWGGVSYTGKAFDNKMEIYGESEFRLRKNISELKSVYLEGGTYYKVFKGVKVGGALRYTHHITWGGNIEQLLRYNIDLKIRKKIKRSTLSYRPRYQQTFTDLAVNENDFTKINTLRNRLTYRYNIRKCKFTPFLSGELFTLLNNNEISNYNLRATIGTSYSFSKKARVKIFYRIDNEMNNEHPYTIHVLGTRVSFSN